MASEDIIQQRPMVDRLQRAASLVLGALAAALIFAMMGITVVDVVGRYGFSRPLPGAFEVTEVMLAMAIFVVPPLVTLENGHITASLLTDRLPPRGRRIQGVLVCLFSAFVLALIAWRLWRHGAQLSSYGDVTIFLRLPKGPLASVMAGLAALGALAALVSALRFLRREPAARADARPSLSG
jgi:TRAP-type transport system small permease protein